MTGCGCLGVVAVLALLLVIFLRGSFDAGEPIEQAGALALVLALYLGRRERSAYELVCPSRA